MRVSISGRSAGTTVKNRRLCKVTSVSCASTTMASTRRMGFWASLLTLLPVMIGIPCATVWKHYGACRRNLGSSIGTDNLTRAPSQILSFAGSSTRAVCELASIARMLQTEGSLADFIPTLALSKYLNGPYLIMCEPCLKTLGFVPLERANTPRRTSGCTRRLWN